jgi:hypothetical protein
MTKVTDWPIAISGLAANICEYANLHPDDYLAGLWRPSFDNDSMWQAVSPPLEPRRRDGPLWSWLSSPCAIKMDKPVTEQTPCVDILMASTELTGDTRFGPVRTGVVKVRAHLGRVMFNVAEGRRNASRRTRVVLDIDYDEYEPWWDASPPMHLSETFLLLGRYHYPVDVPHSEGCQPS